MQGHCLQEWTKTNYLEKKIEVPMSKDYTRLRLQVIYRLTNPLNKEPI